MINVNDIREAIERDARILKETAQSLLLGLMWRKARNANEEAVQAASTAYSALVNVSPPPADKLEGFLTDVQNVWLAMEQSDPAIDAKVVHEALYDPNMKLEDLDAHARYLVARTVTNVVARLLENEAVFLKRNAWARLDESRKRDMERLNDILQTLSAEIAEQVSDFHQEMWA